ncbi:MAG: hypothetical protein KGL00_05055, partial [Gammaproteobacteria bacterium]|nr:hypothetical protein [Gammaproteobacteria bacterium]
HMQRLHKHFRSWMLWPALALTVGTTPAYAHAIAGMRLFPSTLSFDDPGIGAELPLTFSHINVDGTEQNIFSAAFTKPITPDFSLVMGTDYQSLVPGGGVPAVHGWDNLSVAGAWQLYENDNSESIGMFLLTDSIAHTGGRAVGSEYSTWTPEFAFGQGLGEVSANWLKPAAVSGAVSVDIPTNPNVPRTLNWDFSLQYSIPYLQDFVKYVGIKAPFNNLIPIIEFPMQTCLDNGCHGQTTGYINPGVIWLGHYFQWGVELQIPINHRTGNSVGILLGFDFYLDDLAPHTIGAPIWQ